MAQIAPGERSTRIVPPIPAASRLAVEGGWLRRPPRTGYPARPSASCVPAAFHGQSRPPPVMGPDPIVVDARGMLCPWPALRLSRAAREAEGKARIRLLADDPAAPRELA